jgi:hypothetical protein
MGTGSHGAASLPADICLSEQPRSRGKTERTPAARSLASPRRFEAPVPLLSTPWPMKFAPTAHPSASNLHSVESVLHQSAAPPYLRSPSSAELPRPSSSRALPISVGSSRRLARSVGRRTCVGRNMGRWRGTGEAMCKAGGPPPPPPPHPKRI